MSSPFCHFCGQNRMPSTLFFLICSNYYYVIVIMYDILLTIKYLVQHLTLYEIRFWQDSITYSIFSTHSGQWDSVSNVEVCETGF